MNRNHKAGARFKAVLFVFIIISQIVANHSYGQKAANQFRRLDNQSGLSNNHVNTVFTDSRGFLWAGTISGLNRFDGYNFKVFKNDPSRPGTIPFNNVHYIYEDHLGWLWIFDNTGQYTLFNPETETFTHNHPTLGSNFPIPWNNIIFLRPDRKDHLWIGTANNGLFVFDTQLQKIQRLANKPADSGSLSDSSVSDLIHGNNNKTYVVYTAGLIDIIDSETTKVMGRMRIPVNPTLAETSREYRIFADNDNDLWVYSNDPDEGIYLYTNEEWKFITSRSRSVSITSQAITGILQDNKGDIWIGTDHGGLNVINKETFAITYMASLAGDYTTLSGNSITGLTKGADGIIWVGTYKNGINYYHENLFLFEHYRSGPYQTHNSFTNDVNCFAEDKDGNLWIGTNGGGLVFFDRTRNTFITWRNNPKNTNSLSSDVIVSLLIDKNNQLWIGTYQGGLNRMEGNRFFHYRHNPSDPASLSNNSVWQILEDHKGNIWVGTLGGGLDLLNRSTGRFTNYSPSNSDLSSTFVLTLFEDLQNNLWVGTSYGLNRLESSSRKFTTFFNQEGNPRSLSNNHVLSVSQDSEGRIWIGTRNGLNLYSQESSEFIRYSTGDGLPDHNIISMEPAADGSLWIATLNGLSKMTLHHSNGKATFRNFDLADGLQGREFNEHSSLHTRSGELIFGGANGFNIFNPPQIKITDQPIKVIITEFSLFNQPIGIGHAIDGRILFSRSLNMQPTITLRHYQNVFTIAFSALNFFQPEKTRFRYMLEGFNDNWLETDMTSRVATYTNLNPGTYTFRIKAQSTNGNWDGEETTLKIVVIPPFYATGWAYSVYVLVLIAAMILMIYAVKRREKIKFLRRQEKDEYNRMRELDAMKTRFFTNVSHEFRTPLTMILTPVDKLLKETNDSNLQSQLQMIHRNGKRLLNLVNQLLDFRKLEKNKIALNLTHANIVEAVKESFVSFVDLFESKHIQYRFVSNVNEYLVSFDADKLEKIIFNLLSNAVKFTPENGMIELELHRCAPEAQKTDNPFRGSEYVEIIVRDTGLGIAPDRLDKIFERFFQSIENTSVINQGSGIGLALTLEFVRMHGGTIRVDSTPGKGSCFTVRMPLETTASLIPAIIKSEPIALSTKRNANPENTTHGGKKPSVLIVEDNEDLRFYLRENLKKRFTIIEASNGTKGWEIVQQHTPWLVVSDIMMPVEDGISLCRKIKGDTSTSHIPVILLTARGSEEQRLEGLQAGAEDYITKPFNYEVLELKITRLLELRRSFQQAFARRFSIEPGEITITSLDEKFLTKALGLVNQHLDDTGFSVEKMGRELGMSRGHLYNKLVSLTGKTPLEFIRIIRLKRAAQLLGKSQLTVAEIAYQAGFNDPKYFARYFREEYGMNPSEYARKKGQSTPDEQ